MGGELAGKSTLNRLEHARKIGLDRDHKLDHDKLERGIAIRQKLRILRAHLSSMSRTASAHSACSARWGTAATRPPGRGCTSCAGRWSAPGGIVSAPRWEQDETYVAKALGAPVQRGAIIGSVEKGSPAEAGGLKAGDIITAIDGQPVADANEVRNRIGLRERGSTVELTIWRVGKSQTVKLTVAEPRAAAVDIGAIAQFGGARFTDIPVEHPSRGKVAGALVAEVLAGSPPGGWDFALATSSPRSTSSRSSLLRSWPR